MLLNYLQFFQQAIIIPITKLSQKVPIIDANDIFINLDNDRN